MGRPSVRSKWGDRAGGERAGVALVIDLSFGTHPELASALARAIEAYPRSRGRLPWQSFTQRSSIQSDSTRRRIFCAESRAVRKAQEQGLLA